MWSTAGWWIALSVAVVLGVSPLDSPSGVDDNPVCVLSVAGTVPVLAVAGCELIDPALAVVVDAGCGLVAGAAGALVTAAGCAVGVLAPVLAPASGTLAGTA